MIDKIKQFLDENIKINALNNLNGDTISGYYLDAYQDVINYIDSLEKSGQQQRTEVSEQYNNKVLNIFDVHKCIFAIKNTSGKLVKLCATKETAEKELKKYQKDNNYTDFYINEIDFSC